MSTITITTKVTGALDDDDKRAMVSRIVEVNRLRVQQLPFDTAVAIRTSYETILSEGSVSAHLTNIETASTATGLGASGFSDADMKTIRTALADKAQSGRAVAGLVDAIIKL